MKLAKAEDVLAKLGTGNHPESLAMADAGLEFATAEIENVLGTSMVNANRLDIFDFFPGKYYNPYDFVKLQLLATQGFIDPLSSFDLYMSTDGSQITATNYDSLTAVSTDYYAVNLEQGTITLTAAPIQGVGTIAAVYTAGYSIDDDTVPDWLVQAAVGYATRNIQSHSIGYNKKGMRDKSTVQGRVAYSVLSNKIRSRLGTQPSQTVVL